MSVGQQLFSETVTNITTAEEPQAPHLLKLSLLHFCLDIGDFSEAAAVLAEFRREPTRLHGEVLLSALSLAERRIDDGRALEAVHGKGSLLRIQDTAVQDLISLRLFSDAELHNARQFSEVSESQLTQRELSRGE